MRRPRDERPVGPEPAVGDEQMEVRMPGGLGPRAVRLQAGARTTASSRSPVSVRMAAVTVRAATRARGARCPTADGRTLVWRQDTPGTGTLRDIFAMPVDSPSVARAILQTRFDERGIAVGPERDWLAYVSNESGRDEVYIRRLAPGSPRWPVSRNGGVEPRWTRSGEVFFRNRDSVFVSRVSLGAAPGAAPQIAEPTPLFAGSYQVLGMEATWDAAPDGKSFVMVRMPTESRPTVMLYTNWIERWKRAAAAPTTRPK